MMRAVPCKTSHVILYTVTTDGGRKVYTYVTILQDLLQTHVLYKFINAARTNTETMEVRYLATRIKFPLNRQLDHSKNEKAHYFYVKI